MKTFLIYSVVFLTLLGTSIASRNNNEAKGVNVIENAEELFYRRFIIDEDFGKKNAIIEVHVKSIGMLVSVKVDTVNKINSITTTSLPGKTAKTETEQERAIDKDKIVTNQPQNTSITNMSFPRTKNTSAKLQITQHRSAGNSSTWLQKAWNGIFSAMESVMKWLYYGIEWPKDINSDTFARRTVTSSEFTCPADGSVNYSMFNLDITSMDAETTCPVASSIHLLALTDSNPLSRKSQNVTTEESEDITPVSVSHLVGETNGSVTLGTQNDETHLNENGPMGHKDERPETLPEFATLDFFTSYPQIISASPLQWEDDNGMFLVTVDIDDLQDGEDYIYWPASFPEFATVSYYGMVPCKPVSEDHDETDLDTNGNPSVSETSFIEENHSKEKNDSWLLKNPEIENPVLPEEGHTATAADKETLPDPVNPQNHTIKHTENTDECNEDVNTSTVNNTPSNGTVTNERLKMRLNQSEDAGCWVHGDDNGGCIKEHENLGLSISDLPTLISSTGKDTTLHTTAVKKANNKRMREIVIDESVFCLAGLNKSGPETKYCTRKANRSTPETSWFTTKIWNKCMAAVGWLKSSGVPQAKKAAQDKWMAKAPIFNESEICMAGLNKSGPGTEFCTKKAARHSSDSTWFITKLWDKGMSTVGWLKSSGAPLQATRVKKEQDKLMADIPVSVFGVCMAVSNQSGPETEFCTKKAARRLADSQWLTTKLWDRGVSTMRWLRSNETQENARNFTNFYWTRFKITIINWGWQDTFDVMTTIWMIDYCFMALYLTIQYITDVSILIIRKRRLRREICERLRQLELEREQAAQLRRLQQEIQEHELEEERERLRQLELEREKAAQSSIRWQHEIQARTRELEEERDRFRQLELEREQAAESSRLRHETQELKLEEERERLRQLKLQREQAAQSAAWRPKQRKKKRPNHCGRMQKW